MTTRELKNFAYTLAFYANHVNYCFYHHLDTIVAEAQVDAIQFLLVTDCKGVTVERIRSNPTTPTLYSGFVVSRAGKHYWLYCLSYNQFSVDEQLRQECIDYLEYMGYESVCFDEL